MRHADTLVREIVTAVDVARDGVAILDADGLFEYVNQAHASVYGYATPQALHGRHWTVLYSTAECERFESEIMPAVARSGSWFGRACGSRRDGAEFAQEVSLTGMPDGGLVCVVRDISDQESLEQRLGVAEASYEAIFENAAEGIFRSTPEGRIVQANPAMARILGFHNEQELLAADVDVTTDLYVDPRRRRDIRRMLSAEDRVRALVSEIRQPGTGKCLWISENIHRVVGDDGELLYFEGTLEDITLRQEAEQRAQYFEQHDGLTGLPVRRVFMEHLTDALVRAADRSSRIGVLFIDLDRFRQINELFGQAVGDRLLAAVADRIRWQTRQIDLPARLSGDEFGILLEDVVDADEVTRVVRRLQNQLRVPFSLDGHTLETSASVGVFIAEDACESAADVLHHAETAMQQAKAGGFSSFRIFDTGLDLAAQRRLAIEAALRDALQNEQLRLVYQPQIALQDGRVVAAEALLRWRHPELGEISPAEFIPIAEHNGLILDLGEWVLNELCRSLADYPHWGELRVFANLSAAQISRADIVATVSRVLQRHGVAPQRLGLEVTESTLMHCSAESVDGLRVLCEQGLALALDDFGTGYSSLTYLRDFPASHLKIDMSFVQRSTSSERDRSIVTATAGLAARLGLDTIAEGTETEEQVLAMAAAGCQMVQGYYHARPLDLADFDHYLQQSLPTC